MSKGLYQDLSRHKCTISTFELDCFFSRCSFNDGICEKSDLTRMELLKGKWKEKNILNVCNLLVLCWSVGFCFSTPTQRPFKLCQKGSHYRSKAGLCCGMCHQGFRLVNDCSIEYDNAKCEPCKSNQYMETSNNCNSCDRCGRCVENEEVVSPCTTTRNVVCRCKEKYYLKNIDERTRECRPCSECGSGERVQASCTRESNTVCCKTFHYLDKINTKKNCTSADCRQECQDGNLVVSATPPNTPTLLLPVLGCGFVFLLVVVMIFACVVFWRENVPSYFPSDESGSPGTMTQKLDSVKVCKQTDPVCEKELLTKLPDCVPKEIKLSEFIYSLLEQIPPRRVKELLRLLGVSDRVIELAENDHLRDTKEAQYQMLKAWANEGSQGRGGVLPRPLLHDLLVKLRNMELGGAAEELEAIYEDN
ncbi:hypothetical protein DPEC_G00143940 [Dallia pectoralis]|uniref:Uncharacterized protein n=1 Tax=Dallia pectoralis TaxID=75939 RepID=A0ACC2GNI4_DALPE|nr:hypothetical protein DPEC_G00143940 [Dallia pectoralis]